MEPGNQWFVTGSADRTIKVMNIILLLLGSLYSVFSTNQLKDKTQTQPSMVDLISDVFFFTADLPTLDKGKSGDL